MQLMMHYHVLTSLIFLSVTALPIPTPMNQNDPNHPINIWSTVTLKWPKFIERYRADQSRPTFRRPDLGSSFLHKEYFEGRRLSEEQIARIQNTYRLEIQEMYWQAAQRNAELPPAEVKELRKKLWDKIDTETLLEERQNIYGHGRASNVKPYTSKTSIDDQANPQPPNQEGIRERVKKQIPNRKNINNQVKQPTPNQNIIDDELIGDEGPQTRHQKARQTILRKIEAKRKEEEDMVRRGCDIQRKLDEAWQKVAEAMAEEDDCEADLKAIREEIRELERHLGIPANRPQMKRRKTTNIGNTRSEFTIIPPTGPLRAQGKELMQEGVSWLQGVKPGEVVMNVPLHAAALASKARSSLSRYRGPAITGPGTGPLPAVL